MTQVNVNLMELSGGYLFSEVARRAASYSVEKPEKKLIRLGIGDVTRPLPAAVLEAMHKAVDEMGCSDTFRGYGPEQGYYFLRSAIAENDYAALGISIDADEIFISDGAKSDSGNIVDLFGPDNLIAVCDPVYPVYIDTNVMSGHVGMYHEQAGMWSNLRYLPCTAENGFAADIPDCKVDLIYLCFPNNPTGAVVSRSKLQAWVDYANECDAVILFDSAYEAFVAEPGIPRSIFEIDGAQTCSIEFRSFSKTVGFTGIRCAYTVIPKALKRGGACLNKLWNRRQCTKFNGASYIAQRGAEAAYSAEGKKQVRANIEYYQKNANVIREGLRDAGMTAYGGIHSPYIWCKTPNNMKSWDFFDLLLRYAGVVSTPGVGFGPSGEGYVRLSAFSSSEDTLEAVDRIKYIL